jgi:hypothetical protein
MEIKERILLREEAVASGVEIPEKLKVDMREIEHLVPTA